MSDDGSQFDAARDGFTADRTLQAVAALVGVAFLLRFVALGARVAHFDEGRVAYWTLRFAETGEFHYRFIIHGPFIQHVDRVLFKLIGPTDFATRVPVALVGTLLPATALLFRERLRDLEVVSLAAFLALNPLLLYYSRFMRSTLLVAAFCFAAFGLFVRAFDRRERWRYYAYGGVALWALGFAAKENALVYLLCWLGAGGLVLNDLLYRTSLAPVRGVVEDWKARHPPGERGKTLAGYGLFCLGSLVILFVVTLFFYAPRSPGGVGLWSTLGAPGQFPELISAMVTDIEQGLNYWFGRPSETENLAETYLERLGQYFSTTAEYAGPLFALSVAGFLVERYVSTEPRHLVMFASYWGFASVIGYPLGTDIWAAWIIINALVPLAIPAAVGLSLILQAGQEALEREDRVSLGAVAVLLLLIVSQVGVATATGVYLNPTDSDNQLVQYAQPSQSFRTTVDEVGALGTDPGGPDLLVYGDYLVDGDAEAPRRPACVKWFNYLPIPWYLEADDVVVDCAVNASELPRELPPVIMVKGEFTDNGVRAPADLRGRVPDGYERRVHQLRTTAVPVVVYIDTDRVPPQ